MLPMTVLSVKTRGLSVVRIRSIKVFKQRLKKSEQNK